MTPDVLHGALDAGGVGVWIYDPRTGAAEWSNAMAHMHGVNTHDGPVDALFEHVVASDRPSIEEAVAHAPHLDEAVRFEYRLDLPDGSSRWLAAAVSAFRGAESTAPVVSAIATDVTERKEHELSTSRRRARVEGLQWVSQAIIAGEGLKDTATALVDSSADVLGATAAVMLYRTPGDGGDSLAAATTGFEPTGDGSQRLASPAVVGSASGAVVIGDVPARPGAAQLLAAFGFPPDLVAEVGSALLVPIGRDGIGGAICFVREDVGYFSDADVELATAIGSTSSAAMENAHRYEQHRLAAKTFQQHLLPAARTEIDGLDLCTQYHPGRDGLDVGGDWFDVLDLGDRVGVAVGDVCGHGLSAAAHMGQLRYSFRALMQLTPDAEAALGVLNDVALDLGTTATVAYVEIDTATGECEVWRCGHLPPVVADARTGGARWLGSLDDGGTMLGFVDSVSCRPTTASLAVGDVLLVYTDGLVERRGEPIDAGLERLASVLHETTDVADLVDRCGALYDLISAPGPEADDIALVAVRRR